MGITFSLLSFLIVDAMYLSAVMVKIKYYRSLSGGSGQRTMRPWWVMKAASPSQGAYE